MKKGLVVSLVAILILAGVGVWNNYADKSLDEGDASAKPSVKIGVSLPLTGGAAYVGEPSSYAAQMALDNWKLKGTKYDYKLIIEDDKLTIKDTANSANKLINMDKVNAVVSMRGFAAPLFGEMATKVDIPHITCSWGESFFDGKNNFNNTTSTKTLANKMVEMLKMKNAKSVGFVAQLSKSDEEMKSVFVKVFEDNGIEVLWTEAFQIGAKDFRTFWAKTSQKPVDVIVALLLPDDFYAFLKQKKEAGNEMDFTTVDYFSSLDKEIIEGRMYVSSSVGGKEFEEELNKKVRAGLGDCLANIYDNVNLLVYAFENAEAEDGKVPTTKDVVKVLKSLKDYDGVVGRLSVNERGSIDSPAYIKEIKNGEIVVVK